MAGPLTPVPRAHAAQGQDSGAGQERTAADGCRGGDGEVPAEGAAAETGADAAVRVQGVGLVDRGGVGQRHVRERVTGLTVRGVDRVTRGQRWHDLAGLRGAFECLQFDVDDIVVEPAVRWGSRPGRRR